MVPHFFPGTPLPGWDVSMVGTHTVSWGCPLCTGHPRTYPLEVAGAGLLPRGCMVAVPILQGHVLKGGEGDPHPRKGLPSQKEEVYKKTPSHPRFQHPKKKLFLPSKRPVPKDVQPPQKANPKIVRPLLKPDPLKARSPKLTFPPKATTPRKSHSHQTPPESQTPKKCLSC